MKKKLLLFGVLVIILAVFLEISFYFVFIFKPIDRFMGKDLGVLKGIPTTSEILTPPLFSRYISQTGESKKIYLERLNDFGNDIESVIQSKSNFVKVAEANYTLAGTVQEIKTVSEINNPFYPGYEITLKNSVGDKYIEHISPSEAMYARVFLESVSSDSFSTKEKDLIDVKIGDYLDIKRSTNLLNPAEVNIEVKILRIVK